MAKTHEALAGGRGSAIREAMAEVQALPPPLQGPEFTLGICRTFTIDTQLDALSLALSALPCRPRLSVADLDNIEVELLRTDSRLMAAVPDALLVLWRIEELHPRLVFEPHLMSPDESRQATADLLARLERLCAEYVSAGTTPLFLSTLPDPGHGSPADDEYVTRRAVLEFNQRLIELASRHRLIRIFDFAGWAASFGKGAFDLKMDLYAKQAIAGSAVGSFASAVAGCLRSQVRVPAKVLALDLDNVLWGGVLGEDGVEKLAIGHDFPGNVYRRIQQLALGLKHKGVLLALASKNNSSDVDDAFAQLPGMPLGLRDFAAVRFNWQDKSINLKEIASELDLGLDSIVFVDDQKFEREEVLFACPEIRVLDVSDDPLSILRAIVDCRDFDAAGATTEDAMRTADYAAQARRRDAESQNHDTEGFLQTLELRADIAEVDERSVPRVVQMLAKTNQFNVTTRRHSEADVRRMMAEPSNVLLTLALRDRFADQGIIGLAIVVRDQSTGAADVDSFLLSCRALGRGAEAALWAAVLAEVTRRGYSRLNAAYHPTAKNEQVADLFSRLGMTRIADGPDQARCFSLSLPATFAAPSWIERNG